MPTARFATEKGCFALRASDRLLTSLREVNLRDPRLASLKPSREVGFGSKCKHLHT